MIIKYPVLMFLKKKNDFVIDCIENLRESIIEDNNNEGVVVIDGGLDEIKKSIQIAEKYNK